MPRTSTAIARIGAVELYRQIRLPCVVSPADRPEVSACHRRQDGPAAHAAIMLTAAQLDQAARDHADAGRDLTHLHASAHAGSIRFAAVFTPVLDQAATTLRYDLTADDLRAECQRRLDNGQLTHALTGYVANGRQHYAAAWR